MNEKVAEAVEGVNVAVEEQVKEKIADVIEASNEKIAEAEAAAQLVTDAAIRTELGRRVDSLEKEIAACQTQNLSLQGSLSSLENRLSELQATLTAAAPPPVVIAPAPAASSTPRQSASAETAEILEPGEIRPSAGEEGQEKTPPRPRRRLL